MRIANRGGSWVIVLVLALVATPLALADYQEGMNAFKAGKYPEAAAHFQALVSCRRGGRGQPALAGRRRAPLRST